MKIILRLVAFLGPFSGWVFLSVVLGVATILGAIGLMGTSAYVIAGAALHPSIAELQVAIVGVRFFGLARGIFRYLERLVTHSVNFRLLEKLRVWFYRTLEPLSPAGLQFQKSGDLLARSIGDIETLENFYVRALSPPLVAVVVTAGMGFFIGQLHWGLASILLIGLLIAGVGVPYLVRRMGRQPGRQMVTWRGKISSAVVENVQGIADLSACNAENARISQFNTFNQVLTKVQKRMAHIAGLSSALNLLVVNLTVVVILLAAIPFLRVGGMDGVTLAVLTLLTLSSFEAVMPLNPAAQYLDTSMKAGERIFELEEIHPQVANVDNALILSNRLDISFKSLRFGFASDQRKVIQQLDLDIPSGKKIALVGASGSGKSTILNLLLRFWEVPEGMILVNGQPVQKYSPETIRQAIGWLPQSPQLFTGTLRENLLLARRDCTEGDLWSALGKVGLEDLFAGQSLGLDTWIGERGMQLSGGERQRLSIARVLLREAQLFLLDEPLANLDRENGVLALKALQAAVSNRSSIWCMHQLDHLEKMDEIIILKDGCILERGDYHQLTRPGSYFSRMIEDQRLGSS